jgi:hypothetical protein
MLKKEISESGEQLLSAMLIRPLFILTLQVLDNVLHHIVLDDVLSSFFQRRDIGKDIGNEVE